MNMLERQHDMKKPTAEIKKNHVLPAMPDQVTAWARACKSVRMPNVMNKSDWTRRALDAAIDSRLTVRFKEARLIRGRMKNHDEPDELAVSWQFRATQADIDRWTAAAEAEGLVRAEWCRQVLDAAAKQKSQAFLLG